ncbi:hypothetical protein GRX01_03810 [Halobaculum sp. WSA2]|uniref:Uncharacterized protein n=1 Tax=Halobaculum saliterrae TaxID=2073113 RepID=A0A6B0SSA7_9EURY|nr:hypothetical protein [Halobaculum saliterrae]MXR40476.1 hypothetical protein [Halobaculum saliterrae]
MTTPAAPYAIAPLTFEDLCESYVLTWDGRDDPVTVVAIRGGDVIVETQAGDRIRLTSTPDGLMCPDEDTPLDSLTIHGTRSWQDKREIWKYLTDTFEFPTEFSAVTCAADLDMSVEEVNRRLSELVREPRSSLVLVRESYDRWTAYQVVNETLSTQEFTAVLESQTPVTDADGDDDEIVCTLPQETTVVPKSLVDIASHARWAIGRFEPGDGEQPAECTLTPQWGNYE